MLSFMVVSVLFLLSYYHKKIYDIKGIFDIQGTDPTNVQDLGKKVSIIPTISVIINHITKVYYYYFAISQSIICHITSPLCNAS